MAIAVAPDVEALVTDLRERLQAEADPAYVAGTVAARSPGKPVLGIRIPLLRAAARAALKPAAGWEPAEVERAADVLWRGRFHEEELAGCMMLRLRRQPVSVAAVARWAPLLDNWLSVDELGGCVGETIAARADFATEVEFLAMSKSPWQRRLYVVSLIKPISQGLHPAVVPRLVEVFEDGRKPVRMAAVWLLRTVVKKRPAVAEEFRALWRPSAPAALTKLLSPAPVAR